MMIRQRIYFNAFVLTLYACSGEKNTEPPLRLNEDTLVEVQEIKEEDLAVKDYDKYVDKDLHEAEIDLVYTNPAEKAGLHAIIDGNKYPVMTYQGILKTGFGIASGWLKLIFEPYSYWDDKLETRVESPYDFDLQLLLSAKQNKILGYVNFDSSTDNISWDYHENLFTIYYYENENSELFPLNFINEGKTDWDG